MFFSFSKNDEGQTADDKKASENNASLISEENSTKRGINTPYWTEEKSTVISKKRKIDKHEQGISTGGQSHYKKEHEVSETPLPYIGMIAEAIFSNPNKKMVLAEIYAYMERNFFHYLSSRPRWRNTVRHNLSFHNCFVKCECSRRGNRSHFWCVHPDYVEQFKRGNFTKTLSPPREQMNTQNVQGAYHRYYERDYSRECLQETQHEYSPSSFNAIPIIRYPHTFSGHMTTPTAANAVFQSHHTLNSYQAMQTSSTRGMVPHMPGEYSGDLSPPFQYRMPHMGIQYYQSPPFTPGDWQVQQLMAAPPTLHHTHNVYTTAPRSGLQTNPTNRNG